ncbi:Arabinogalactan peptide 12 [Capsicum chinense]|nr:Arabinogalactan peptide 12 [Capsicum chinense]
MIIWAWDRVKLREEENLGLGPKLRLAIQRRLTTSVIPQIEFEEGGVECMQIILLPRGGREDVSARLSTINMNMKIIVVALVITMVAISAMNGVSAADAPAPAPASDATTVFVPAAVFSSFVALAFALLF